MRFGKSADEAAEEPSRGGGGGDFIRNLKDGDTTFRLLQEPDDWTYFWEHFNPSGFSFPCTNEEDTCPGCISDNEKMRKVSRKIAFNVLHSFNGQDYVNVYKVPNAVALKLKNRFARFATVTDRDYTVTRYKTAGDRYDFDVEGGTITPIDLNQYDLKDIEQMLADQFEEQWGDGPAPVRHTAVQEPAAAPRAVSLPRVSIAPKPQPEDPPFEAEKVYQEADLRAMGHDVLLKVISDDLKLVPPSTIIGSKDAIVDWLMQLQS